MVSRRIHRWMRRIITAVVELRPRPSWSLSTKAVRSMSVCMHRSRSSVMSWNFEISLSPAGLNRRHDEASSHLGMTPR